MFMNTEVIIYVHRLPGLSDQVCLLRMWQKLGYTLHISVKRCKNAGRLLDKRMSDKLGMTICVHLYIM